MMKNENWKVFICQFCQEIGLLQDNILTQRHDDVLGGDGSGFHEGGGVTVRNKSFILILCCLLT